MENYLVANWTGWLEDEKNNNKKQSTSKDAFFKNVDLLIDDIQFVFMLKWENI